MIRTLLSRVALVALFASLVVPVQSFAASSTSANLLSWSSWHSKGGVAVSSSAKTITFDENEDETQYVYQDISVDDYAGKYLLISAFTQVEEAEADGVTGYPKIYAYVYNDDNEKIATLSGQYLTHDENADDEEWAVSYGIFALSSKADTIRLFVEQTQDDEDEKEGNEATVYKVGVFGTNSQSAASLIQKFYYTDILDDMNDDDTTTSSSNTSVWYDNTSIVCSQGRSKMDVDVQVTSMVYADDADSDTRNETWILWVANRTSWFWSDWGKGNASAYGNAAWSKGRICAKSGDEIRINGTFEDAAKYLVYRNSGNSAADQILDLYIGGKKYEIGSGKSCNWVKNNSNGYDVICVVK